MNYNRSKPGASQRAESLRSSPDITCDSVLSHSPARFTQFNNNEWQSGGFQVFSKAKSPQTELQAELLLQTSPTKKKNKKEHYHAVICSVHIDWDPLRLGWPPSWVCLPAPSAIWSRHHPGGRSSRRRLARCLRSQCQWLKGAAWWQNGWTRCHLSKLCLLCGRRVACMSDWVGSLSASILSVNSPPLSTLSFHWSLSFCGTSSINPLQPLCYRR